MTKQITKTKNSTLKTNIARLLLALVLVVAQAATIVTPALAAETVSTTSTVTVNGVKYTTLLKQGQAQLTVGDKAIILSKENVMAAVTVDQYGTAVIFKNNKPRYEVKVFDDAESDKIAADEDVLDVSKKLLKRNAAIYEELAK